MRLAAALLMVAIASPALAQEGQDGAALTFVRESFGTCQAWLSEPIAEAQGEVWLQGYWSALNIAVEPHNVGHSGGWPGVLQSIKMHCQMAGSDPLAKVALEEFVQLRAGQR